MLGLALLMALILGNVVEGEGRHLKKDLLEKDRNRG
jgi:hypothetical protein